MAGHVDLHVHLLPGVDDGPRDERASLEHAARMARAGVREAVVTPHVGHPAYAVDVAAIPRRTRSLQAALDRARIPLRLHAGGEIHPSVATRLTARELATIAQGPPGARWVLAEIPFAGIDGAFLDGCAAIRARGFALVIAHPERAAGFLPSGLALLERELAAGALLQVNVCSLLGDHGAGIRAAAELLVRDRRAYVLASDGHGGHRSQTLRQGCERAVAAGASPAHARRMTQANPAFLLRRGVPAGPRRAPATRRPWRSGHDGPAAAARDAARRLLRGASR